MPMIKVLGSSGLLSVTNHLSCFRDIVCRCTQILYVFKVLCCHGMFDEVLRYMYKPVVLTKLLYVSLVWRDLQQLQISSTSKHLYLEEYGSFCTVYVDRIPTQLVDNSDQKLFRHICLMKYSSHYGWIGTIQLKLWS